MGLYGSWKQMCEAQQYNPKMAQAFWGEYFEAEQRNYEKILEDTGARYEGTLAELAGRFDMEPVVFCGFMDGINTSLRTAYELEDLKEDTPVFLDIDFEKLYYNMLEAKADWLYKLPQWESVLSPEKRHDITKEWRLSRQVIKKDVVGRNDPCPCGSGKKYKKCCGKDIG